MGMAPGIDGLTAESSGRIEWRTSCMRRVQLGGEGEGSIMKGVSEQGKLETLLPWPPTQENFLEGVQHQNYR